MMLYIVKSSVALQTIRNEIVAKSKEMGLGVLNEYAFKDILKSKGHHLEKEVFVYELCNPVVATQVLSKYPEVSVYLPCRVSVYEEDGQVVLSTLGIDDMTKNFDLDDVIKSRMDEVFNSITKMLNSWN